MFIVVEDLKPEPLHVAHVYQAGAIPFSHADAALAGAITTDFVLTHEGSEVWINGELSTSVRYKCSRCLKEYLQDLAAAFDLHYVPQPKWLESEEIELKYEEMVVGYYDGVAIDVDLVVLEQIELAIPMKFVCREDCRGLCAGCGADLNEVECGCEIEQSSPRMASLLEFRKRMDKSS